MIRSGVLRTLPKPARAAIGNLRGVVQARIEERALAVHLEFATNAFQCVTDPQPVQVCRLTPARPNAGGISVAADLAVGPERLAVEDELGVELARAPGC